MVNAINPFRAIRNKCIIYILVLNSDTRECTGMGRLPLMFEAIPDCMCFVPIGRLTLAKFDTKRGNQIGNI